MRVVLDIFTILLFMGSAAIVGAAITYAYLLYRYSSDPEDHTDGE